MCGNNQKVSQFYLCSFSYNLKIQKREHLFSICITKLNVSLVDQFYFPLLYTVAYYFSISSTLYPTKGIVIDYLYQPLPDCANISIGVFDPLPPIHRRCNFVVTRLLLLLEALQPFPYGRFIGSFHDIFLRKRGSTPSLWTNFIVVRVSWFFQQFSFILPSILYLHSSHVRHLIILSPWSTSSSSLFCY